MGKELAVKSSVGNFVTQLLIFPLTIITGILVSRLLGVEGKGNYAYLLLIGKSLLPILYLGFGSGLHYYISNKTYQFKESFFSFSVVAIGIGIFTALIIYILHSLQYLGEVGNSIDKYYYLFMFLLLPLNSFYFFNYLALSADFKFKIVNYIQLTKSFVLSLSLLSLLFLFDLGLLGTLYALIIEGVVSSIIILFYIVKNYRIVLNINLKFIKASYNYGVKSWVGTLAQQSNDRLDQILISFWASPQLLGLYSVAFSIVSMVNFLPNAIAPVFFNLTAASKDKEAEVKLTGRIHRVLLIVVGTVSIGVALSSDYLVSWLYGEAFGDAAIPLKILIPGMLAFAITRRIVSKYLASKGMPMKTSFIQGFGAIVGVILYFVLIPKHDIIGAAWASTIAYMASAVLAVIIFTKVIRPNKAYLFRLSWSDIQWLLKIMKPLWFSILNKFKR